MPHNLFGYQVAHGGTNYAGIVCYVAPPVSIDYREYIQTQLSSPLIRNKLYVFEMYVSVGDSSNYHTSDLGVVLTDQVINRTSFSETLSNLPQIVNTQGIYNDTANWVLFSEEYFAIGGEEFVIIGNFKPDSITTVVQVSNYSKPSFIASYLLIDDVSLRISPYQVELTEDTILCQGDELILDATTTPNAVYLWQDGSTNATYRVTQAGTYWAQSTSKGIVTSDSVVVNYKPNPTFSLGPDTSLCEGELLRFDLAQGSTSFIWQDSTTLPSFTISNPGLYWAKAELNECIFVDSIIVDIQEYPELDIGKDTTICVEMPLELKAVNSNSSYLWQDGSDNSSFEVKYSGTYWLKVSNNLNERCFTIDSISIQSKYCKGLLTMPNVFTPNNDGKNDLFVPITADAIESLEFKIYNRLGRIIFETNNVEIEWDGGNHVSGVYYWVAIFENIDGNLFEVTGNVTLLR